MCSTAACCVIGFNAAICSSDKVRGGWPARCTSSPDCACVSVAARSGDPNASIVAKANRIVRNTRVLRSGRGVIGAYALRAPDRRTNRRSSPRWWGRKGRGTKVCCMNAAPARYPRVKGPGARPLSGRGNFSGIADL